MISQEEIKKKSLWILLAKDACQGETCPLSAAFCGKQCSASRAAPVCPLSSLPLMLTRCAASPQATPPCTAQASCAPHLHCSNQGIACTQPSFPCVSGRCVSCVRGGAGITPIERGPHPPSSQRGGRGSSQAQDLCMWGFNLASKEASLELQPEAWVHTI